ncbi:TetR/AcrR family transcriptional regulator [Actinoplanes sp. TBRC 11911]|uniref:TetR/AcrR family transcriptional regulator n=1 Tax=Actinoplanes sp. TBRC 11911 TaxID=2729386 RepID=UPI00145D84F5|nr:TetR/AcrR family transcriptional regulator [Actinoplanes sp. TBRC 11911]NMO55895.1 TetR/AcrR family transcriptional regulator [Actinoplanes sp. TBRC 11911]
MSSNVRRPYDPAVRRAAVVAAVMAATERLLAGGVSFTELGIKQIAAEVGLARSTFYLYFSSKTELVLRLVEALHSPNWESSEGTPVDLEAITEAYRTGIAFFRERKLVLAAVLEAAAYDPEVGAAWEGYRRKFVQREVGLLRAEQAAGRTPAEVDAQAAAEVIIWGGFQVITHHVTTRGPERDDIIAQELAANQYYGVYRRGVRG